ncbi:hypothetical protein [Desulfosporosinus sp. SB140]|uniref:hypothetical protein n=1 Tax=Desulfosporosinus paludis TaxID=3115649 RepID=UPI00388E92D3
MAIASVMFAVLSITPISMAYAQNATTKVPVKGPGHTTKVPVDSANQKKGSVTPQDTLSGQSTLGAYNMAPRLPLTMEADYGVSSFIGPIASVRLYITFDDGEVVTDNSNVWQWFKPTYGNATQHQFATAGTHKVSLVGTAWTDTGLTINYDSISDQCVVTN